MIILAVLAAYIFVALRVAWGIGKHMGETRDFEDRAFQLLYCTFWPVGAVFLLSFRRAYHKSQGAHQERSDG